MREVIEWVMLDKDLASESLGANLALPTFAGVPGAGLGIGGRAW